MVTAMWNSGRDALIGARNWTAETYKAVLVNTDYTYSSAHQNLSDIPGSAQVSTVTLTSRTVTNGILSAASPLTWPSVSSTSNIIGIAIYYDSGVAASSTLIGWYDGSFNVTISASTSSSTSVSIDPTGYFIANSATLTRTSGSGPSTITLSATGGNSLITISGNTSGSTNVPVNALTSLVPNSVTLLRYSGTGPSTIVLSAAGGAAGGATALTSATAISCVSGDTYIPYTRKLVASSGISCVEGDVYSVPLAGSNMPITSNPNGGQVTFTIDPIRGLMTAI